MTSVREERSSIITGSSETSPTELNVGEWLEVINRAVGELTIRNLRGMQPLKDLLVRCTGGMQVTLKQRVLHGGLPREVRADTPLLFCAAIQHRAIWGESPDRKSAGWYLVMSREKRFFELRVTWRECDVEHDGPPPTHMAHRGWYDVFNMYLKRVNLDDVLKSKLPITACDLGLEVLIHLFIAQKTTAEDIHGQYRHAERSAVVLEGYLNRLGRSMR